MRCATDIQDGKTVHAGKQLGPGMFQFEGRLCIHQEADSEGLGEPIRVAPLTVDQSDTAAAPPPKKASRKKGK